MKPGLYVATVRGVENTLVMAHDDGDWFCTLEHVKRTDNHPAAFVSDARPLVVLDPESEDDCRRLMEAALAHRSATIPTLETIRGILRALADPKPPEPTGLGAVVRDRFGKRWIRVVDGDGHDAQVWYRVDPDHAQERMTTWDGLVDPAEVLSEGWSE